MSIENSRRRWWVCALLFLATAISYVDRQAISIVAPVVMKEFSFDNRTLANILSAFVFAYTFGQLGMGRFFDWVGSRCGFAISIGLWSLANALCALVTQSWGFQVLRFLLGIGESGNFPGGIKVISEWFSAKERPFAGGLFTSGASIGAIVAGPLIGSVTGYWGWRAAFLLTGVLGFVWLMLWLVMYRWPAPYQAVSGEAFDAANGAKLHFRWLDFFRFRQVWALFSARFLEEGVIWVCVFWLPKYFVDVQHLSVLQAGWLLAEPFVTLDVGYIAGGWISTRLIRRGWNITTAKYIVIAFGAVLMTGATIAGFSRDTATFTACISLATLGHGAWFSNVLSMPADLTSSDRVASLYGICALGGGLGGIVLTEATGAVADRFHSFAPIFVVVGMLPLIGTAVLVTLGGKMNPLTRTLRMTDHTADPS